jgi:O-antigen ligase
MNRALTLSGLVAMGAIVVVASLYAERHHPGALLVVPLLFGGGFVVIAACMGKPWALKLFLFALIFLVEMAFRGRRVDEDVSVDGSILYRLALWSAALVIGLANLPASVRYLQSASLLGLLAYLMLAVGSASYSLVPTYTLGCAYGYFCILLFMAAVVSRVELREVLHVAMLAVGAHVVIAILLWLVAPDRAIRTNWAGEEGRLGGLLGTFPMAHAASLFLLSGMIMWRERWLPTGLFALIGALSAFALFLTQTRSAMVAAALGLMSAGRFRPASTTAVVAVFLTGMVAVNALPGALEAIATQASRSDKPQGTLSLTGRTYIWGESLRLFAERPLLGYGFAATRTLFPTKFIKRNPEGETPPHAHNVIVQSLVTMGIVGTVILLIPLSIPVIHSLRHRDGIANPLIWYTTIMGLAVLGPIGARPGTITLFWMLSLLMIQMHRSGAADGAFVERQILGRAGPVRMDTSPSSQIR